MQIVCKKQNSILQMLLIRDLAAIALRLPPIEKNDFSISNIEYSFGGNLWAGAN